MKINYDPKFNIAYISFLEKPMQVDTIRISDELNVDLAPDGTIYGLELLNANHQLGTGREKIFEIVNSMTGESSKLMLPV